MKQLRPVPKLTIPINTGVFKPSLLTLTRGPPLSPLQAPPRVSSEHKICLFLVELVALSSGQRCSDMVFDCRNDDGRRPFFPVKPHPEIWADRPSASISGVAARHDRVLHSPGSQWTGLSK